MLKEEVDGPRANSGLLTDGGGRSRPGGGGTL